MAEKREKVIEPCACRGLHVKCHPQACSQQEFASRAAGEYSVQFEDLRKKATTGCVTCRAILDGINLPRVKRAWLDSIGPAVEGGRADARLRKIFLEMSGNVASVAESFIRLTILPRSMTHERVVIRTNASHSSQDWRHFNFNLAKRPTESSCTPFPALSYDPVDHTDSSDSFRHLTSWLETCNKNHACYAATSSLLPKRVLRITADRVFLYLSQPGERGRYTTLSYRWGTQESFTLTQRNIDHMMRGIALSNLPKTSQDAVRISQHIGVGFIWIDSLCIVQTDKEDWKEQSMRMSNVYGGSYLNIAANDSTSSEGGCFRKGSASREFPALRVPGNANVVVRQQPHFTHHDFGSNYGIHSGTAPLLRRSWVLQERLLSPRVIYYGKDELLWECKEASDCQCGGITTLARFKEYFHNALKAGDPLPFAWMRISERYSALDITYDSDRAIALSGIAQHACQSGHGGRYLAGLWMQNLAHQLCWRITNTWRKPTQYLAPSWSWLSVFGSVSYCNRMDFHATASRIDAIVTEASCTAARQDGTGAIEGGRLIVNGRTLKMNAQIQSFVQGRRAQYRLLNEDAELEYDDFHPDYVQDPKEAVDVLEVTVVYWGKLWQGQTTFMVLTRVQTSETTVYQRLGVFALSEAQEKLAQRLIEACQPTVGITII